MSKRKKWKFKGIDDNTSFSCAGVIIILNRCETLKKSINLFLDHGTEENLHSVRIAIRRLRYNMEVFSSSFEKKKFTALYNLVEHLQDLTGKKRDLDVLLISIKNLSEINGISIDNKFFETVENQKNMLNDTLQNEFFHYLKSDELNDFAKILNKRRRTR